jgi:hypothetical protein
MLTYFSKPNISDVHEPEYASLDYDYSSFDDYTAPDAYPDPSDYPVLTATSALDLDYVALTYDDIFNLTQLNSTVRKEEAFDPEDNDDAPWIMACTAIIFTVQTGEFFRWMALSSQAQACSFCTYTVQYSICTVQ